MKKNGGPDIIVIRRRGRAYIQAASRIGAIWLVENIALIQVKYEVPIELLDELVKTLKEEDLQVEVK